MLFSPVMRHCLLLLLSSSPLVLSKPIFTSVEEEIGRIIPRGALANGASLRVLCLGASITYGYESTSGNGYRYALRGALANDGNQVTMIGSLNHGSMENNAVEGWVGYRIEQVAAKAELSLPQKPNVVLINAGLNDAVQNFAISTAHDRMGALIDRIIQVVPNAVIVVSALLPNADPMTQANVDIINAGYRDMVASHAASGQRVSLVELSSNWFSVSDLEPDGSHPTDEGYVKMAKMFYNGVVAASGQITEPIEVPGFRSLASENDPGASTALEAICQGVTGALAEEIQCSVSTSTAAPEPTPSATVPTTTAQPVAPVPEAADPTATTEAPVPEAADPTTTTEAPVPTTTSISVQSISSTSLSPDAPSSSSTANAIQTLSLSLTNLQTVVPSTTSESSSSASETTITRVTSSPSTSLTSAPSTTASAKRLLASTALSSSSSSPTPTHNSGYSLKSQQAYSLSFGMLFAAVLL